METDEYCRTKLDIWDFTGYFDYDDDDDDYDDYDDYDDDYDDYDDDEPEDNSDEEESEGDLDVLQMNRASESNVEAQEEQQLELELLEDEIPW